MSDIEHTVDEAPSSPPARPRPKYHPWLILTGALVLLNLITFGVLRYQASAHEKATAKLTADSKAALDQANTEHQEFIKVLVKEEGETLARSFQMVNPQLLTDKGQMKALGLFAHLGAANSRLKYIVLFDGNGAMCASTNLLLGPVPIPPGMEDKVVSKKGRGEADVEYFGPITDSSNNRVGTVLIGLSFTGREAVAATTKPSAVAPENAEPVPATPAPAPTPAPVPDQTTAPAAPQ